MQQPVVYFAHNSALENQLSLSTGARSGRAARCGSTRPHGLKNGEAGADPALLGRAHTCRTKAVIAPDSGLGSEQVRRFFLGFLCAVSTGRKVRCGARLANPCRRRDGDGAPAPTTDVPPVTECRETRHAGACDQSQAKRGNPRDAAAFGRFALFILLDPNRSKGRPANRRAAYPPLRGRHPPCP